MNNYYLIIFCFAASLLFTGAVSGGSNDDILVSSNVFGNYWTAADGDNIVWLSKYEKYEEHPVYADAKYRIIVYNITSEDEIQIFTKSQRPENPDISGRYVVWADYVPGSSTGYDIWCHDLKTNVTKVIAGDYGDQKRPVIAGDIVLWSDYSGPSSQRYLTTYLYNLTEERILDTFSSKDSFGAVTDGEKVLLSVSNETVSKIYTYDIRSKEKRLIWQNNCGLWSISVSGDNAAWIETKKDGRFISCRTVRFCNLKTGAVYNFSAGNSEIFWLDTDGSLTVFNYGEWKGTYDKNGTSIWVHDHRTHQTSPLPKRDYNQARPSVADGKIVWQDCSPFSPGIYLHDYYQLGEVSAPAGDTADISTPVSGKKTPGFCFSDTLAVLVLFCTALFVRRTG